MPPGRPPSRSWPGTRSRKSCRWARRSTTTRWRTASGRAPGASPSVTSTRGSASGSSPPPRPSWPRSLRYGSGSLAHLAPSPRPWTAGTPAVWSANCCTARPRRRRLTRLPTAKGWTCLAVCGAARQVQPFAVGKRVNRRRLGRAVQQFADQTAGVPAVHGLGDGAKCASEPEPYRNDLGQLGRGGGDEPDALPRVEVTLGEAPGALPDAVRHRVVVDLLAQRHDFRDLVPGHEREGGLPGGIHVAHSLDAAQPERHLSPGEPGQVARAEHLARGEPASKVVDRGAPHHRVVQVEKRRGRRIGFGRDRLDLSSSGRGLPGPGGPPPIGLVIMAGPGPQQPPHGSSLNARPTRSLTTR